MSPDKTFPDRRRASPWHRWTMPVLCGALWACMLGATTPILAAELAAVVITRPQHGETVHDNTGTVPVIVTLQGVTLSAERRLRVFIDGNPYVADQRVPEFALKGIERGEHRLQVQLLDDAGRVLATSLTTTFYLWQASSLFPNRKPDAKAK